MKRFRIVFPVAVLLATLLAVSSCHRVDKNAEQLAALDAAYKTGVLTKDEYDAKKLALTAATPTGTQAPAASQNPAAAQAPAASQDFAPAPSPALVDAPTPTPQELPPAPVAPPTRAAVPRAAAPASSIPPSGANVGEPASAQPVPTLPAPALPPVSQPTRAAAPVIASSVTPPSAPAAPIPRNSAGANEPEPAPLAGCEDVEYKSGGQKGAEERFFAAPPEAVWRAAVSALDNLDFTIHKSSIKGVEASKKRHIGAIVGAGGERVILTLQKAERGGQSGTRVSGETKKNFVGRVTQRTWTDAVLAEIACKLRDTSR
jgi:hypothetical protein